MTNNGFILIHRKFIDWEWYSNPNVVCLFLHCLLLANWEDKKWRGIDIKRGQFFTSIEHLSESIGISTRSVRTSIEKLKSTNEIEIQTTSKGTMITVCKYDTYQDFKKDSDKPLTNTTTNDRQTTDKRPTTTKEYNTLKQEEKETTIIIKFLNELASSNFSPVGKAHLKHIEARIKEGRSVLDFKLVIKDRCKRWMGNAEMSQYLRPETLFGNKFDGYLSEAIKSGTKIEDRAEVDEVENNPLILSLDALVRSQMSWRDKIDYINSKQPQIA